jgi:hypothetical protein
MLGYLTRVGARAVYATTTLDRAYLRADRLRSLLILALASDTFLEEYCRRAYDRSSSYDAESPHFRRGLFNWEQQVISRFFPPAPARILLGGAGGGREAFALVEMGYSVVAFDPAPVLAASMARTAARAGPGRLDAYLGGYEDLPVLNTPTGESSLDLRSGFAFDAAILGWCSFSHLVRDSARISALAELGQLTRGPILVSYFSDPARAPKPAQEKGLLNVLRRRARRRGSAMFASGIGYARYLDESDLRAMADRAGLDVLHVDNDLGWPHAIVHRSNS